MNSGPSAKIELSREVDDFREHGYVVVPDALTTDQVARLVDVLDEFSREKPARVFNIADILGLRDEFVELIDLPTVLPKIEILLGKNIWVNHSHYNINPPVQMLPAGSARTGYGWHRDGGAINDDIPAPAPLLSIKVGFYLTDLSEPGRGQTYLIGGSHKSGERPPDHDILPDSAAPLCVSAGTAVLYDRRLIHSIRSKNDSDVTRMTIFVQYAFRWMCAVDEMTVIHLRDKCNPVRLQLLGLSSSYNVIDGAAGRSGRYYPGARDVPLFGDDRTRLRRFIDAIRDKISRN